ncbi:hypothetical protein EFL87_11185 [Weissella confusa]|nr:hypothetical protein [Weissella confusa]
MFTASVRRLKILFAILKLDLPLAKTDSSSVFANKARMWISVIASKLMRLMKNIALEDQQQLWTINTF